MKLLSLFLLSLAAFTSTFGQNAPAGFDLANYGVRIEPDTRVMVVLATLEAARTTDEKGDPVQVIKTPLSAQGAEFRDRLTSDLAELNPELRQRISTFLIAHKARNKGKTDAEIVAPFVSMAYALTPAPELADPVVLSDLPGSLLDVLDFAPLVRDFYRRSSFSANLPEYKKLYLSAADTKIRTSAREMVNELLSYLRTRPQLSVIERITTETQRTKRTTLKNVETRERERKFTIVPELLAPAGTINFVNVRDEYYVVLTPETDLVLSDVRRAFLQFVVDPIVITHAKDIASIRDSVKKILDERRASNPSISPDVYLTISRSLVAAIDAKQLENVKVRIATDQARAKIAAMGGSDPTKQVFADLEKFKSEAADETYLRLSEDFEKGAILAFYFAEQMKGVEESGTDIAAAMREMILAFDASKEEGRYEKYADARARALALREKRKTTAGTTAATVVENPVTNKLFEIQKTVDAKDYKKAEAELKELLKENPNEPRVFYNLGRVASLTAVDLDDADQQAAKLLEAKVSYENVVRISQKQPVDPALLSLSYVALAKIFEFYDNLQMASGLYDAAIKLGDMTGGGFREAMAAKQRLVKNP
jgi:tetratricopeptide (TPR) repeat protein